MTSPLSGVRVLDRTGGIAGPYCTKILVDAGADVVKVEAAGGDALRRSGTGALFEYLNAGKRSIADDGNLLPHADALVVDGEVDISALWAENPRLVVVSITPFGLDGPWAGRPWTEFTLQAACGSIGGRGVPERAPLAAGGRIGEWTAGTYAAAAAIGALRSAKRSGLGEHVDVAMLDCMAVTMVTATSVLASFAGWTDPAGPARSIEVPSIEPTSDGYVVFTTNSAQQIRDFLVMIGRPDFLDDPDWTRAPKRFARREEFLPAVHGYTTKRTTEEILDDAARLRIPAGPVLNGATVTGFEQFRARRVFRRAASGRFDQPLPPYRIGDRAPSTPRAAPGPGDDAVTWSPRPAAGGGGSWQLPLEGVRIVDCTAWWAGPVASHALACLGADVIKVESVTRPDNMRFASAKPPTADAWWEWGWIFHAVNVNKRGVTLDLTRPEGVAAFERLVETADVLVENYTPRVMEQFGLGWERLHRVNPALVMVRMPAFGLDGPWRDRTGFAQTMESVTGMAWLTGFADGPPVLVRGACDPVAGMHAVIATLLALASRDDAGEGMLVESTMVEAALNVAAEQLVEYQAGANLMERDGNRGPVAAPQGVYPCLGDDRWVAIAVATDGQWEALREVAGWDPEPSYATADGRRLAHDVIDEQLARWTSGREAEVVVEQLVAATVPAEIVVAPHQIARNPQLRHRRLFEVEHHPVTGDHELPAFPVRFSRVPHWHRRPSPTLGHDTVEVLTEIGLGGSVGSLEAAGVIGDRPVHQAGK